MNELSGHIIAGLLFVSSLLSHFAIYSVKKYYDDLEKQTEENSECIIGIRCEIAALQERTKKL